MKTKIFTRAVSVMLSNDIFARIQEITDREKIGISDFIRDAIQKKLEKKMQIAQEEMNYEN